MHALQNIVYVYRKPVCNISIQKQSVKPTSNVLIVDLQSKCIIFLFIDLRFSLLNPTITSHYHTHLSTCFHFKMQPVQDAKW